MPDLPLVLHIPHSSTVIPEEVRQTFCLSGAALANEVLRITDHYTEELFAAGCPENRHPVVHPVSRLVVDPERFLVDAEEPMAAHGLGAVYTRTADGNPLRSRLEQAEREKLLALYYHPHHRRLYDTVDKQLTERGSCLIIDCHSFPEIPFPFENNRDQPRPDICIGTDAFHTPDKLTQTITGILQKMGYTTALNHPFSGCLVPLPHYRRQARVFSVMLEINRKGYMQEETGLKNDGFTKMQQHIRMLLQEISSRAALY